MVQSLFADKLRPAPNIFTLVALAGVGAMAMNVYLPSMPGMVGYFETTTAKVQLSVSLFLGFNAVFQLFIGPLSDRFGRRPLLLWSLLIFCLATLAAIFSPTIEFFLVCRVIQAVVVGCMVMSRAAIRDLYDTNQAASMIGYVTMGMAIVPMVAPAIGGWLDTLFDWRGSFWLLLAFGVSVLILAYFRFGETNKHPTASVSEQFSSYPELFKSRRFWAYVFAAATASGAFFAYLGGAPFVGQQIFGLEGATLGLFLSTPAIGYAVGNFISGRYAVRVGINWMILWGALLSTGGLLIGMVLSTILAPSPFIFFGFIIAMGLGNGMCLPNAMSGMMSVRPHLAGSASGIGGTAMMAGGAGLSMFASTLVDAETGANSLMWVMIVCSFLPMVAIGYTMLRERSLQT